MFDPKWMSLFVVAALFSGCSKEAEKSASSAPARGEPINSQVATESTNTTSSNAAPVAGNVSATETKSAEIPPAKSESKDSEFVTLGFDKLASYTFNVPEGAVPADQVGKSEEQIPKEVKEFDAKKVALTGFMLPLKVDNGLVTELLLMKDQAMCCYGAIPRINDWVSIKMKTGGVKSVMDQPVTLYGKMRVGEMLENGYLVGIYEMAGEKMDEPKN